MDKNIQLILQTRIEKEGAVEQATALGGELANAIAGAFDNVGEKIANNIFTSLTERLKDSSLSRLIQNQIDGALANQRPFISPNAAVLPAPAGGVPQAPIPSGSVPGGGGPSGASAAGRATYVNPFDISGITRADEFLRERLPNSKRSFGLESQFSFEESQRMTETTETLQKVRLRKAMLKANPNMDPSMLPEVSKDEIGRSASKAEGLAATTGTEISDMVAELRGLKETLNEANLINRDIKSKGLQEAQRMYGKEAVERTLSTDLSTAGADVHAREAEIARKTRIVDEVGAAAREIREGGIEQKKPLLNDKQLQTLGTAGQIAAAAGQAMQFVGQYRSMTMQGEAGLANAQNFSGRAMSRGDLGAVYTDGMMGGQQQMRKDATSDAAWSTGGKILGGVGLAAAGVATGGAALLPMLLAGGALGMSGARDAMTFDSKVSENMQNMRSLKGMQQQERLDSFNAARGRGMGAFGAAQDMGDINQSDFIYGKDMVAGLGMKGMSSAKTSASLAQLAASMGGDMAATAPAAQSGLELQAKGFSNFPAVAGGIFQGMGRTGNATGDRSRAMRESEEMYGRAIAAGITATRIPDLLSTVAQQAAGGMGMGDLIKDGFARVMDNAKALGLGDNAQGLKVISDTETAYREGGRQDGVLGQAKIQAIKAVNQEVGGVLTPDDILDMKRNNVDKKGLADLVRRRGGTVDNEDKLFDSFTSKYDDATTEMARQRGAGDTEKGFQRMNRDLGLGGGTLTGASTATAAAMRRTKAGIISDADVAKGISDTKAQTGGTLGELAANTLGPEAAQAGAGFKLMADALPELNKRLRETIDIINGTAKNSAYLNQKQGDENLANWKSAPVTAAGTALDRVLSEDHGERRIANWFKGDGGSKPPTPAKAQPTGSK